MNGEFERIKGALLGCCIGDAMGMPTEMWSPARIQRSFGEIKDFLPGPDDNEISAGLKAGETTDDSIITMIIAGSMIKTGRIPEPMELVNSIDAWSKSNPKSKTVIGPSTQRAFQQIANGVPPEQAGRFGETNGASMRISPVGIISSCQDMGSLVERVHHMCLSTHNTDTAISAASAVAASVANGIDGGCIDELPLIMLSAAQRGSKLGFETCSPSVEQRLRFSMELSDSVADDEEFMHRQYSMVGCGLPSTESVPTALTIALRCKGDVMRCAKMCANIGGDTDTMGAIACAISGAHTGMNTIQAGAEKLISEINGFDFDQTAREMYDLRRKYMGKRL